MPDSLKYQTEARRGWLGRNYDRAVWYYETTARLYSGGLITASKRHQLNHIEPGDRVLFLGVGSGEDAVMAAAAGAEVTCVDISQGMLAAVERRLAARSLQARLVCQSAYDFEEFEAFDVCCANYFLNVFHEPDMVRMLRHAVRLVRSDGKFMIADVALPQGRLLHRAINRIHHKFAMVAFWVLGLVPLHADYDYLGFLDAAGIVVEEVEYFKLYRNGPVVYQCIVGRRRLAETHSV